MITTDQKRRGLFFLAIGIILVIAMALVIYFFKRSQEPSPSNVTTSTTDNLFEVAKEKVQDVNYSFDATAEANRVWGKDDIKKMAMSFAERLGSFSNHSDFGNIRDLKIFMTPEMVKWADNYIIANANTDTTTYFGITTVAISGEVTAFGDTTATVVVNTSRSEMGASGVSNNYLQKLSLTFIKDGTTWKVNDAKWLAK